MDREVQERPVSVFGWRCGVHPPGNGGASAPLQKTTSTRATSTMPAPCPMRWSTEGHHGHSRATLQALRPGLAQWTRTRGDLTRKPSLSIRLLTPSENIAPVLTSAFTG